MQFKITHDGFRIEGETFLSKTVSFLDSIFRGIGQVLFQNNSFAGILFLCGIFYNSVPFGFAAFFGAVVSTLTARLLRADIAQIKSGLFGFNGTLSAIGLLFFLHPSPLSIGYLVIAAAVSSILMAATLRLFESLKLPTLTAPFVFTTLCFLMACARFGRLETTQFLPNAGLPQTAHVEGIVSATTFFEGLLKGVSQVFFQENMVTGALFLIGLLIGSRRCFTMAIVGSIMGIACAWLLGASEPAIRSGAFGFNSVLTAIALGSIFLKPNKTAFIYAILGTALTPVAFAALSGAFEPIGMPAMTLPFVVVTWLFILASSNFPAIKINN